MLRCYQTVLAIAFAVVTLSSPHPTNAGELSYSDVNPFDIQMPTHMGQPEKTIEKAQAAVAGLRPTDDIQTINLIGQILAFRCEAHVELRQYLLAEAACLESVATFESIAEADPTAMAQNSFLALPRLAMTYEAMGDLERALKVRERQLKRFEDRHSAAPEMVALLTQVGELHFGLGDFRQAEATYLEAIATQDRLSEYDRDQLSLTHLSLAKLYRLEERFGKAEVTVKEGLADTERVRTRLAEINAAYGLKSHELDLITWQLQILSQSLALIYFEQGRLDEARDMAQGVLDHYKSEGEMWTPFASDVMVLLARIEDAQRPGSPEAARHLVSAVTASKGDQRLAEVYRARAQCALARHHLLTGNDTAAEPYARVAVKTLSWSLGEGSYVTARAHLVLAWVLQHQEKDEEALRHAQAAFAAQWAYLPPYHSELGETLSLMAELYSALGQSKNLRGTQVLIEDFRTARKAFESER